MRLLFLGTAAAEGYPAIFCDCPNCNQARALGGRNLRYRSALLVNDDLLIDFGPDLMAAAQRFGLNLSRVTTALVTHAHADHFLRDNAHMRLDTFTARLPIPTLRMFGPQEVTGAFLQPGAPDPALMRMALTTVHAFEHWQVDGYSIQAYRAQHALGSLEALFYSIDDGRSAFLYASDTGPFPADTWQALAGRSFDAIVMEETMGSGVYDQHMGFDDYLKTAGRMRSMGLLRPNGRLLAHHFSHTSNPDHAQLEAFFSPHGVEVAYDGLEVMI
jgi:phosphoribosyl 1,2-cyclic phosphate phosphodiesterase